MADFTADLQGLRSSSFPFLDMYPTMEQATHFTEMNLTILDNSNLNCHIPTPFSNDNFFAHQPAEVSGNFADNFPGVFHQNNQNVVPVSDHHPIVTPGIECENHDGRKRKIMGLSGSSSMNSSPQVSENGTKRKNNSRRGKRVKSSEMEEPKEVVHVRARRGQATDSHSLAERVRREKINERLRCLQDIVPGCYKTMGMAVMLEEIINYVQSLQNQVEFLSMKLTAASTLYDFNAEPDGMETMLRAKAQGAKEMERMVRERNGGHGYFQSSWSL